MGRGSSGKSSGVGKETQNYKASQADMPTLNGTEKQVRWANDIRTKALQAVDSAIESAKSAQKAEDDSVKEYGFAATISGLPTPASTIEAAKEYVNVLKEGTQAKDYIDNRDRFSEKRVQTMIYGRARMIDKEKKRK